MGLGMFRVQGLGFGVWGLGFRVLGSGFGVEGFFMRLRKVCCMCCSSCFAEFYIGVTGEFRRVRGSGVAT